MDKVIPFADRVMVLYGDHEVLYGDNEKKNLPEEKQVVIPQLIGGQYHCGVDLE
jgi:hypothetical protein